MSATSPTLADRGWGTRKTKNREARAERAHTKELLAFWEAKREAEDPRIMKDRRDPSVGRNQKRRPQDDNPCRIVRREQWPLI